MRGEGGLRVARSRSLWLARCVRAWCMKLTLMTGVELSTLSHSWYMYFEQALR